MDPTLAEHCQPVRTGLAEVHVHRVSLTMSDAARRRLRELLSTDEQERAATFRFDADRARFVVVRAVLRLLLSEAGLGPAECLTLVAGRYGKPELAHVSSVRFNVAHSGNLGVIAIATGQDVGVDVQEMRARPDLAGLARRFFTRQEALTLAALPEADLPAAFYRCWVRKEACVKAVGLGLRAPFDGFDVGTEPFAGRPRRISTPRAGADTACTLVDVDLGPDYPAALAVTPARVVAG